MRRKILEGVLGEELEGQFNAYGEKVISDEDGYYEVCESRRTCSGTSSCKWMVFSWE